MKKDINFHKAEGVYVVAVKEWDKEFLAQDWNVYVVNNSEKILETVLVVSRGSSTDKKTSTLRFNLKNLQPQEFKKIEFITEEVLSFTNEYLLTYFSEDKLFERSFVFEPFSISEENMVTLPVLDTEGILAK